MGRHSRKGRAKAGLPTESAGRTAPRGDALPSYEPSHDEPYDTTAYDGASYETASIYRTDGYYAAEAFEAQGYETVADEPSVFERPALPPSYATQRQGSPAPAPAPAPAASPPSPAASPAPSRYGHRPAARGGHPEQREPGGGWGADGAGRGPGGTAGADEAGRVLQARSGNFGQNPEQVSGPSAGQRAGTGAGAKREDAEVFENDLFGSRGASRSAAPSGASRGAPHATSPSSPSSSSSPSSAGVSRGGARTPLPRYGDGGASPRPSGDVKPDSGAVPGGSLIDPGRAPLRGPRARGAAATENRQFFQSAGSTAFPQAHARTDRERERGIPDVAGGAAPPRVPVQGVRSGLRNSGPAGRAFTGVLAVAVATVLAFVVAGQLTSDVQGDDKNPQARGLGAGEPAPRTAKDGGAEAEEPAAPSYDVKMARTYPLQPELKGQGDFTAVSGSEKGAAGGGTVLRYRVDVEKGLPLDSTLFARAVHKTLNDKRSWAGDGKRSFERVAKGDVDFVITLASSPTTDEWCAKSGLDTSEQNVSCDSASTDRVMINAYRWAQGSKTFGDDRIYGYRQMLINHEVGHRIGLDHVGCSEDGALAPVMMQQTKSLESDGKKCRPNPWVRPDA